MPILSPTPANVALFRAVIPPDTSRRAVGHAHQVSRDPSSVRHDRVARRNEIAGSLTRFQSVEVRYLNAVTRFRFQRRIRAETLHWLARFLRHLGSVRL